MCLPDVRFLKICLGKLISTEKKFKELHFFCRAAYVDTALILFPFIAIDTGQTLCHKYLYVQNRCGW